MGFSWTEFAPVWSKNGVKYTPSELSTHLKKITKYEKYKATPTRPLVTIPQHNPLLQLGYLTVDVENIDSNYLSKRNSFNDKARSKRRQR